METWRSVRNVLSCHDLFIRRWGRCMKCCRTPAGGLLTKKSHVPLKTNVRWHVIFLLRLKRADKVGLPANCSNETATSHAPSQRSAATYTRACCQRKNTEVPCLSYRRQTNSWNRPASNVSQCQHSAYCWRGLYCRCRPPSTELAAAVERLLGTWKQIVSSGTLRVSQ